MSTRYERYERKKAAKKKRGAAVLRKLRAAPSVTLRRRRGKKAARQAEIARQNDAAIKRIEEYRKSPLPPVNARLIKIKGSGPLGANNRGDPKIVNQRLKIVAGGAVESSRRRH